MKRSRSGQAGFAGLWRRWRFQSATAISAMPIGMPGCPDFAASTASIASARMELASSASVALAVTEESMGTANYTQRLYGTALLEPARLRGLRRLRGARRGALVRDRKSTRLNSSHLVISY